MRAHLIVAGACLLAGCGEISPRLGYPYLESSHLVLEEERLRVDLNDGTYAKVEVRFVFVAPESRPALEMAFPEDGRDPALDRFEVRWDGRRIASSRRETARLDGHLPLAHVNAWHGFTVGAPAGRHVLEIRYRQPLTKGRFRYLMRTGAYWRGPMGELQVEVQPASRVARGELEGLPGRRVGDMLRWSFTRLEPRGDLVLALRAP